MQRSGVETIKLSGELDIARKPEVQRAFVAAASAAAVLVDFREVTYADSSAIAELWRTQVEADSSRVPVAIVIGHDRLRRVFQYAGLLDSMHVYEDQNAALSYLESALSR